jgi:hypothetical protein
MRRRSDMESRRVARTGRRLLRFFIEYVGNVDADEDRRRNREARILMDQIMNDMSQRGIPSHEFERSVERIRESLRAVEPERSG